MAQKKRERYFSENKYISFFYSLLLLTILNKKQAFRKKTLNVPSDEVNNLKCLFFPVYNKFNIHLQFVFFPHGLIQLHNAAWRIILINMLAIEIYCYTQCSIVIFIWILVKLLYFRGVLWTFVTFPLLELNEDVLSEFCFVVFLIAFFFSRYNRHNCSGVSLCMYVKLSTLWKPFKKW